MKIVNFKFDSGLWPYAFSEAFISYLNNDINGKVIYFEENEIILPVLIKNKFIFKTGFFISPPLKNGCKISKEEEMAFFEIFNYFIHEKKIIDFIFPPLHIGVFSHIPSQADGYELGIIKLDLKNKTEEELFANFRPNFRNLIRKAIKDAIEVKFGEEYFDEFYSVYKEKKELEGTPYDSIDKIKLLLKDTEKDSTITCGVAYNHNKLDSAILNVQSGKTAYYLFAGNASSNHPGASRLLQWELIKLYLKKGLFQYQFGGARNKEMKKEKHYNIEFFKSGFGTTLEKGFHFTFIVSPFKYKLYKQLIDLKSKLSK